MNVIEKNLNAVDDSFIGQLHEYKVFDIELFDKIIVAAYNLIKDYKKQNIKELDYLKVIQNFFLIYRSFSSKLIYHFCPNDLYKIKNLEEEFFLYLQRFGFAIKCLIEKDFRSIEEYEDDLGKIIPAEEVIFKKLKGKKKNDNFHS